VLSVNWQLGTVNLV